MVQNEESFKQAVIDLLNGQVSFEDGEYSYVEIPVANKTS
jgi:hypothetical protein